ncbi:MAG: tail protein X [Thermoguttaceae bacterium]|jgi:nucleoid-associated protein YgaU
MKDPAVKVALAISVLIGGVFIAIVFQPVFSVPPGTMHQMNTPLSLQHQQQPPFASDSQEQAPFSVLSAGQKSAALSTSSRGPTVLSPLSASQQAPDLPPRYPAAAQTNSARWGMPTDMMPIVARPADGPHVHKIVDGDTLGDLAARYLGTAARAMEIFAANRDVLADPELLPIGVELKIPARGGGNK